jgi:SAM-dependent methyltransferase
VSLAEGLGKDTGFLEAPEAPERFDPNVMHGRLIEAEHLARYWWAARLCTAKRVLDAGCGTGYGSNILAESGATEVVGLDIDSAVLEAARESAHQLVSLEVGDVRKLPFADASFEVAVCFEVIEHVDEPGTVLDELRRVLRAEGILLVSSPNRDVYPPGNPHHKHEFRPDELARALSERFAHVRLIRQHDWLGSGVLEDAAFSSGGKTEFEAVVRKAVSGAPGDELYTLGLASTVELPATSPYVVLTRTADAKWWHEKLRELEMERDAAEERARTNEQALADVVARLAERDSRLTQAEAAKVQLNGVLQELNAELEALRRAHEALSRRLVAERVAFADGIARIQANVYGSRSWRYTAPLRRAMRILSRLKP